MTDTFLKYQGNSLGVRLPAAVARAAGLRADQRVRVSVEGERVVIERVQEAPLTLEQRLARFNPDRHGGQALVSERVGAEQW